MNELPDIPGVFNEERMEPISVNPKSSRPNLFFVGVLSVFFAVLISGAVTTGFVILGKERILSLFGYKEPPKADILLPVNKRIDEMLASQQAFIEKTNDQLQSLKSELDAVVLKKDQINTRLALLENSTAEFRQDVNSKIAEQKKQQDAKQKAQAVAQPKPIVVSVQIVSIRGWGHESYVTLKEGLDYSELLAVGDTWRGWTLLSADANTRKATFKIQNQVKELVM